mmetsp:Transcript_110159/g.237124  ORF Transcript_110159/g.237124 Transcript_110159/m.237124 type:complete len:223 (-) Transcript_110159:694-1362(-)
MESAPNAQAMCESCGAENLSIVRLTLAPISAMSSRFCTPATAMAHVIMATSVGLNLWMEGAASLAIALMSPSCGISCFEKAQATFASSGGAVLPGAASKLFLILSAIISKSFWSWRRRFANAQARKTRSSVLNSSIFSTATLLTASIIVALLTFRLANDQAVMARDPGGNSATLFVTSFEMAVMSSSLRVPHCAMAQETFMRHWAEKVSILEMHSWAIVVTS